MRILYSFILAAPLAAQIAVKVASPVNIGQPVKVSYTGPADRMDFISIVPKSKPEGQYEAYAYARASPVDLVAPETPGEYEVRYLKGARPYTTLARAPLTVRPATATLNAPAQVQAGQEIKVAWTGPANPREFITLVPKSTPEGGYENYVYADRGSPATLRAPDEPGEYEVRYLTANKRITLGRAALRVGGASASITAPASVKAGAPIRFQWTGPNNAGDFFTVVPAGTPDKEYRHYVYTGRGNPAEINAPDAAGAYEIRYLTGQTFATLAKASITVSDVSASVKGPASVEGGTTFPVSWTGPGNSLDWISIAPASPANSPYRNYVFVTRGNPVNLAAPLEAGAYELRYNTGGSDRILARAPIRVGPPKVQPGKLQVVSSSGAAASRSNAVEVILDASGSMLQRVGAKRRIEIARQVLVDLVQKTIPAGTPFALRVFGHKEAGSCRTDLEQSLAPLAAAKAATAISGITPKNLAKTPIGRSLELVAEDLKSVTGERIVVLVTDGEETCGGDPAAAIAGLRAQGADVRVNIVGFAITEQSLKNTFRNWSRIGGGEFFDAATETQLGDSLVKAVQVAYEVVNPQGNVIGEGIVGGDAIPLAAGGPYKIRTKSSNPRALGEATIKPNETTTVTASAR